MDCQVFLSYIFIIYGFIRLEILLLESALCLVVIVIQSESEKAVNQAVVILLAGKATNSCMEGRGKKCLIFTFMLLMEGSH